MAQWWKIAASLPLVAHFAAVVSGVLAPPQPRTPVPELAAQVNHAATPYLDALFLNSSFRFYAPNPGPARLMWCRFVREDGHAQWREFPARSARSSRACYQRWLSLAACLDMQLGPDPEQPSRLALSPAGQVYASSFVRRLVRECDQTQAPIELIELYSVHHRVLEPQQIAAGWTAEDLRLYRPCLVGRFAVDGEPLPPLSPDHHVPAAVESSRVAAWMCQDLARLRPEKRTGALSPDWPTPLRQLLARQPELIEIPSDEVLKEKIERLARTSTRPEHPPRRRGIR